MASRITAFIDRFATLANDPELFLGTYSEIQTEDQTLLSMGGVLKYNLYRDCEKDPFFCSTRDKMKRIILGREFSVVAADENNEKDLQVAKTVQERLQKINTSPEYPEYSGFDGVTWYMLEGIFKGMQPAEVDWNGQGEPIGFRTLPANRVGFWIDEKTSLPVLKVKKRDDPVSGVVPPPRKVLNFAYNATSNNPSGVGLCSYLWWCAFFKRNGGILPWGEFNESFANPTPDVSYPPGSEKEDIEAAEEMVQKISARSGVAHSSNVVVQFLEAMRTGSFETYERWVRYWDEQIAIAMLGESATSNQSAGNGSRARDEVASAQQLQTCKGYVDLLHSYLESTLIRWIVDIEFGFDTPVPLLSRQWEDPENLNDRADRDAKLKSMGYRLTPEKFQQVYGEGYEYHEPEEQAPREARLGDKSKDKEDPQQFALPRFQDQIDLDNFADELPIDASLLVAPIEQFAKKTISEDEFYVLIAEQFTQLDTAQLEDLLARAIFTASIWGEMNSALNK
jgi:phage gp29-like protein